MGGMCGKSKKQPVREFQSSIESPEPAEHLEESSKQSSINLNNELSDSKSSIKPNNTKNQIQPKSALVNASPERALYIKKATSKELELTNITNELKEQLSSIQQKFASELQNSLETQHRLESEIDRLRQTLKNSNDLEHKYAEEVDKLKSDLEIAENQKEVLEDYISQLRKKSMKFQKLETRIIDSNSMEIIEEKQKFLVDKVVRCLYFTENNFKTCLKIVKDPKFIDSLPRTTLCSPNSSSNCKICARMDFSDIPLIF